MNEEGLNWRSAWLVHLVSNLRWAIPLTLAALGVAYVLFDRVLLEGHIVWSPEVYRGVLFLGLAGPILAWMTLTWALRAALAEAEAQRELTIRNRELATLNAIGEAASQSLNLEESLQTALERLVQSTGLETGGIWLVEGDQLVLEAQYGEVAGFTLVETSAGIAYCPCGRRALEGEITAATSLTDHSSVADCVCAKEGFQSILNVPMKAKGRVIGVIQAASRQRQAFALRDQEALTTIGGQIAMAVENARLFQETEHRYSETLTLHAQLREFNQELERKVTERTRELAEAKEEVAAKAEQLRAVLAKTVRIQEKERARISRDMHDGVAQLITGVRYELQAAQVALKSGQTGTAGEKLDTASAVLDETEKEIRRTIYDLHPPILDAVGLVAALRKHASDFQALSTASCYVQVKGNPCRLPSPMEVSVYRMVAEAMNNAATHGGATAISIILDFRPASLWAIVQDNGRGFDYRRGKEGHNGKHLGLIGMQERARSLGGVMRVWSMPEQGTMVAFRLPIQRD